MGIGSSPYRDNDTARWGVESLFCFRLGSSQQRLVRIWLGPGEAPRSLDGALSYNREGLTYYVSLATLPFEWAVGVSL